MTTRARLALIAVALLVMGATDHAGAVRIRDPGDVATGDPVTLDEVDGVGVAFASGAGRERVFVVFRPIPGPSPLVLTVDLIQAPLPGTRWWFDIATPSGWRRVGTMARGDVTLHAILPATDRLDTRHGRLLLRIVGRGGPLEIDRLIIGPGDWWRPSPRTTWQWQLSGDVDTSFDVEMYDVDLFDTSAAIIDSLHADGRTVVCYFSAGSRERWRDDAGAYPPEIRGRPLDGWAGERWVDIRRLDVLGPILEARLDLASHKGCDGVEPDNVDAFANTSGFALTAADQVAFNRWLADAAHARGLSVGLKNDLDQVLDLVGDFDWALDEQCFQYDECDLLTPFIDAGKAVFGVEYQGRKAQFCPQARALGFSWSKKRLELDAWVRSC